MYQKLLSALKDDLDAWAGRWHRHRHGVVRDKVFFLHIPKCGGTSVTRAINSKFAPENIQHLDVLASTRVARRLDLDLMTYWENLLFYYMAMDSRRLVSGHFNWSDRACQLFGEDWKFVTVLRHPVRKWLSQYHFNRYKDIATNHFQVDMDISAIWTPRKAKPLAMTRS